VPLCASIKFTIAGMKTKLTKANICLWPEFSARNPELQHRGRFPGSSEAWLQRGQSFQRQVCVVWMILKDPRTPWYVRVAAAGTVGYLFSPVQLIPSFIPVIGLLDDFAALWLGFKLIQRFAPAAVLRECNEQAARMPPISAREMKRVARMAAVAIAMVGLSGAAVAVWWLIR
jgi:uncharacterized membrane protein YkvA (DUF1232 family)